MTSGITPHSRASCRATWSWCVRRDDRPPRPQPRHRRRAAAGEVGTTSASARSASAMSHAAFDIASPTVGSSPALGSSCRWPRLRLDRPRDRCPSSPPPRPGTRRPPSRPRASAPTCRRGSALATSLASARVGSGAWSIDSSICVAVITGLPRSSAARMIRFWSSGTAAGADLDAQVAAGDHHRVGASTIVPSACTASAFSIFAITRACEPALSMQRAQIADVVRRAHERQRDVVHAQIEREGEVVDVLLRQRRDRQRRRPAG